MTVIPRCRHRIASSILSRSRTQHLRRVPWHLVGPRWTKLPSAYGSPHVTPSDVAFFGLSPRHRLGGFPIAPASDSAPVKVAGAQSGGLNRPMCGYSYPGRRG
jgi:hypothetical protein